jgi:serine/threonine-protein kinase PknK
LSGTVDLPPRYEALHRLGKGGGGEVWAVRDSADGAILAMKLLSPDADHQEIDALVREASALSGLEGLGLPRVLRFGRIRPSRGRGLGGTETAKTRPYLLRELVQGQSLLDAIMVGPDEPQAAPGGATNGTVGRADADREGVPPASGTLTPTDALLAVADAADKLARIHGAGLLHGDIKPANIIVQAGGEATLVDLGLAAPLREAGQAPTGLTPRYAAPELFEGEPLGVRAEVYSLGITLREVVERFVKELPQSVVEALEAVIDRATRPAPHERFPSIDELGVSLRTAARLGPAGSMSASASNGTPKTLAPDASWTVRGIDSFVGELANRLLTDRTFPGLLLEGPAGSGKSAVLRRLAWSLGVSGEPVGYLEAKLHGADAVVEAELAGAVSFDEGPAASGEQGARAGVIIVDDPQALSAASLARITEARRRGARVVASLDRAPTWRSGTTGAAGLTATTDASSSSELSFSVLADLPHQTIPPLDPAVAGQLVQRAIPSVSGAVVSAIVERAQGRPGTLRSLVRRIGRATVVSVDDVTRVLDEPDPLSDAGAGTTPVARALVALDQGRVNDAARLADSFAADESFGAKMVRARIAAGRGETQLALALLRELSPETDEDWGERLLHEARALIRTAAYNEAIETVEQGLIAVGGRDKNLGLSAELTTSRGIAESFLGQHEAAIQTLSRAAEWATESNDPRVIGIVEGSFALALQRTERLADAKIAYQRSLAAAERASDAGTVTTMRLNLAALAIHGQGEIAEALVHLEAAVDMGRRAGRDASVRQALLNLANLDLYLGRLARAAASIETLSAQRDALSRAGGQQAQLLGLEAELANRTGSARRSALLYDRCAKAYDELSRRQDAAEARIEAVLLAARQDDAKPAELRGQLDRAATDLGDGQAHRAPLLIARAAVAELSKEWDEARALLSEALTAAEEANQREWVWRALDVRSRLESEVGRTLAARRDIEAALSVLEDIGSHLPKDLREVYWNDPRRRGIRAAVSGESVHALVPDRRGITQLTGQTRMLADDRLARILEVNRELATLRALPEVLERVIQLATDLVQAERGYVLLLGDKGLTVHAVRTQVGSEERERFSRSVAERAIDTGEPVVSLSARDDARMAAFDSVHQLALESVACVPIRSPRGRSIGALYVETRSRRGTLFEREVLTLRAFADQAAIAIETARLLEENASRAAALAEANAELSTARERLAESLDHRTHQLAVARKDLKDTKAVLRGHFGYQGLVGTSPAMRAVYAVMDRLKDSDIPMLITGESGTGKEVIARAIHQGGPRAKQPFLGVNCGAIPDNLLESELFGHVRGAFTGADRDRKGLFRECEGGTVLLDEVGEMPLKMQAGLLRVLQERTVRPVGGNREEPIDVRVIAATHRNLEKMVAEGTFREDLYYRLRVVELHLPALRERAEDIPVLVDHFLGIFAARHRREKGIIRRDALRLLEQQPFPGNVRQLENMLLNAWVLAETHELTPESFDNLGPPRSRPAARERVEAEVASALPDTAEAHKNTEKDRILEALNAENWNRVRAAERLGMPRRTFYRRLKEYEIQ